MSDEIILGSQSPRRREILGYFSLPFKQAHPNYDEEALPFQGDPDQYVCALSKGKADSLSEQFPESIILTADTIVFRAGKIYGKPKSEKEACLALSELVGQWHDVYTGVTVQKVGQSHSRAERTRVLFNNLTEEQIRHYVAHTNWADKAGGYAIQMAGGLIVSKIEGCYYNVMGLPINTVCHLLKNFNIDLWNYL